MHDYLYLHLKIKPEIFRIQNNNVKIISFRLNDEETQGSNYYEVEGKNALVFGNGAGK